MAQQSFIKHHFVELVELVESLSDNVLPDDELGI